MNKWEDVERKKETANLFVVSYGSAPGAHSIYYPEIFSCKRAARIKPANKG